MAQPLYLDTSAAVPLFVQEPGTEPMRAFLKSQPEGEIAISPWVATEFAGALARKLRAGTLDEASCANAAREWHRFLDSLLSLEITIRHFEQAGVFCSRHSLGLRAGDALHLAIAAGTGCTLVTLDERLAKAAAALGVPVVVP